MYLRERTLDDLLHRVISKLLKTKSRVTPTRGEAAEVTGVLLHLDNPRARLSRTETKGHVFSCLGELFWYLAGSNEVDFISYYVNRYQDESDDGHTIHGAYGPRLLNMSGEHNQVQNVIDLLRKNPFSRRAVIQIFEAADIASAHKEIPCTCTLQFLLRDGKLNMLTYMRSNDAFFGMAHDVFTFTMIQEMVARTLGKEVGFYKHAVGSLHLYNEHRKSAEQYIEEAIQPNVAMPPMPTGDPRRSILEVLEAESRIRKGSMVDADTLGIGPYWQDLVRLLLIFRHFKCGDRKNITQLKKKMSSPVFDTYIEHKKRTAKRRDLNTLKGQLPLNF